MIRKFSQIGLSLIAFYFTTELSSDKNYSSPINAAYILTICTSFLWYRNFLLRYFGPSGGMGTGNDFGQCGGTDLKKKWRHPKIIRKNEKRKKKKKEKNGKKRTGEKYWSYWNSMLAEKIVNLASINNRENVFFKYFPPVW